VIKAGKLTFVVSGPKAAYDAARPYLDMMGVGSSYVGEGELARIAKICHNVMLGVVIQNLCEITVLAEKAGMPRHAFLDFLNKSVMGSMFTRYKAPALVNLDFHVTFTPKLLRKDLDLGLEAGKRFDVPMPLTSLTRDLLQQMIGRGMTEEDFSTLLLMQAQNSGLEIKPENWNRVLEVNLTGTFHCCQVVLPEMIEEGWGRIVNISSSSTHGGQPLMAPYVAAKSGVIGLTKSLALEFGPKGITVNTIPPGFVDTPMMRAAEAKGLLGDIDYQIGRTPVRRVGRPEDIAAMCSFLCSDEAGYVTGQVLGVNGGRNT
jgi:NAD(P)-dependent dehydrogenase (short-subunit alcohol dehydrogenase family)